MLGQHVVNVHLRSGKHTVNYTRMKDEDFMDTADETLRIAASQFRSLKKSSGLHEVSKKNGARRKK